MKIVSGIQPTGTMHLGNYLGAVRHWADLQDENESFFFLADLHAITMPISAEDLQKSIFDMTAMLMACGIGGERSVLFSQRMVPEHTELQWILSCTARMGWLNRMTQYKDKGGSDTEAAFRAGMDAGLFLLGSPEQAFDQAWAEYDQNRPSVGVGLFTYPVLQAADVLLYDATHVPVGDDQDQHLQLVRDISAKFNTDFGVDLFTSPAAMMAGSATRVMSLKNGRKKMSKSDPDDMTRINLIDSNDLIAKKIKRAVSDSDRLPHTDGYSDAPEVLLKDRPEALNLLTIYAALIGAEPYRVLEQSLGGEGFGKLKGMLTDAAIDVIAPIRTRYHELRREEQMLWIELCRGADKARAVASPKMQQVRKVVFGG